jgi:two-component system nitrogen regulation response regulator GlnG
MASILVVEDDTALRRVYRDWLRRLGHEVEVVSTGMGGLKHAILQGAPDLIISDLMMPGSDGDELVASLGELAPKLPVLIISGCGDAHRMRAIHSHPNVLAVFPKPVDRETLVRNVEDALAGRLQKKPPRDPDDF